MFKYLIGLMLLTGVVQAEVKEALSITEVLPLIDEGTWLLVDLDNTLFQAKQALGHVNWLESEVQKQIVAGKTKKEAFHAIYPIWKMTQELTEVVAVEPAFSDAIQMLQERNIPIMGVTHRQLFIVDATLRQLESLQIDLLRTAPSSETLSLEGSFQPALYTHGILFVDDFNTKGEIVRLLMRELKQKPNKIVFIDDKLKNVQELEQAARLEGIEYVGIHYRAAEQGEPVYDPALAAIQRKYLNQLLDNEQARQILEQEEYPEFLYKIVSVDDWSKAILLSSQDQDFIHLATENQLERVIAKFWSGQDFVVLRLATNKLPGHLIYERNPGGTNFYYHLYGGDIPLDAVVGGGVE